MDRVPTTPIQRLSSDETIELSSSDDEGVLLGTKTSPLPTFLALVILSKSIHDSANGGELIVRALGKW